MLIKFTVTGGWSLSKLSYVAGRVYSGQVRANTWSQSFSFRFISEVNFESLVNMFRLWEFKKHRTFLLRGKSALIKKPDPPPLRQPATGN